VKLAEIAALVEGELIGADPDLEITAVASLAEAASGAIAPVIGKHGIRLAGTTRASALLVGPALAEFAGPRPRIIVARPGDAARTVEAALRARA
jgi:UDP-3-O-[3-hydroxymyristoyl] glucosamine N-acyltransferase